MCNYSDGVYNRGRAEEFKDIVKTMLETLSVSQIAKALKRPEADVQAIADSLEKDT